MDGTNTEDDHSIEGHVKAMQQEMVKVCRNEVKLRDSMVRTFESRRQYIADQRPAVRDLLDKYPALGTAEEVKKVTS